MREIDKFVLHCRQVLNVLTASAARLAVYSNIDLSVFETASATLPRERHLLEYELEDFKEELARVTANVQLTAEQRECHDPPIDVLHLQELHAPRPIRQRPGRLQLQLSVHVALGNAPPSIL